MTATVGQNLPAVVLQRPGIQQSGAKTSEDGAAFDDLLDRQPAAGKEKAASHELHGSHWERIRAGFVFGGSEHEGKTAQFEQDTAKVEEESGDEKPADKKSAETTELRVQFPEAVNFQGFGRASSGKEGPSESGAASEESDPLRAGKTVRLVAIRGQQSAEAGMDEGPKDLRIQGDRSALRNGTAAQPAVPSSMSKLTPDTVDGNAAASNQVVNEEGDGGSGLSTQVDMGANETDDRRISGDVQKPSGASRASIVAEQNFPAPASQAMSETARSVIDAIASSESPAHAAATAANGPKAGAPVAVPAHILKIELHPAELGTVTASMRLSGEQLSIELKPETYEAHRRLTSDSEAIVKSLRALGFDVDKVTILQPSIATTPAARADAAQPGIATGRDQSSFQQGNSGGNGDGMSGQQSGRNRGDERHQDQRPGQPSREHPGSGLFI